MTEMISIQQVVTVLNEALNLDPVAISKLVLNRVPCDQQMENHPTIKTEEVKRNSATGAYQSGVGLLGILNGLFGIDGEGKSAILAVVKSGLVIRFQNRLTDELEIEY